MDLLHTLQLYNFRNGWGRVVEGLVDGEEGMGILVFRVDAFAGLRFLGPYNKNTPSYFLYGSSKNASYLENNCETSILLTDKGIWPKTRAMRHLPQTLIFLRNFQKFTHLFLNGRYP